MKVSSSDIKNSFGKYLKECEKEDIYITRNDRIVARLSSYDDAPEGYIAVKEGSPAYNYSGKKVSYEEFLHITEGNEERYEYIEGEVYLLSSPGFRHQLVHSNLNARLLAWFAGKKCLVFSAPFDITLYNAESKSKNVVQPDLLVICDHNEKEARDSKDRYWGVPSLVVEILSPQSRSRDMVKKLNVYLEGGVKEYWLIDPSDKKVIQYYFKDRQLEKMTMYGQLDTIKSMHFEGLEVPVDGIMAI